jgi:hypothetical protein
MFGPPGPMKPPMAPPAMGMSDLAMMPAPQLPPEGVELWGNPVLDAPPLDESMFAEELAEQPPLDMGGMGMDTGMAGPTPMNPDQVRQAAAMALADKAKKRMAASQAFQASTQPSYK